MKIPFEKFPSLDARAAVACFLDCVASIFPFALLAVGGVVWFSGGSALALSSDIVLAEIFAGGGNTGSPYRNDYILLFNRGTSTVSITNWSVQYAAAAGSTWQVSTLTNVSIPAGGYFLIQEGFGGEAGVPLPTPDLIPASPINLAATAGKVALVNHNTALTGSCPSGPSIVDLVGFGATANCSETAPAPAPGNATAAQRKNGGCSETDTNANDFAAVTPNPRNSGSPLHSCIVPTPPTGTGLANPNSVAVGGTTLLTVTVTPGEHPASTSLTVTGNLASIGGLDAQLFYDDATHGDVTVGDRIFSFEATVDAGTVPAAKTLPVIITDAESRTGAVSIALTVTAPEEAPDISAHPTNQTVWAGGSATFTVSASGTPSLQYQWRFNEVALPDQTNSSLALSNLLVNQSGNYDVVVTNHVGSITSIVALLTVRAPLATNIAGLRTLVDEVNYLPTDTTNLYQVEGVVTTHTNLTTAGNALFYVQDDTAGIAVFVSGSTTIRPLAGERVRVIGPLAHFNGLLELNLVVSNPTHSILTISGGNPLPAPVLFEFSAATNIAVMETNFEGRLVVISNVFLDAASSTFPNPGNVTLTNLLGETFTLRVDSRVMDIAGQPRPVGAEAIIGVIAQSDTSDPRTSGYQILPSRRADIIDGFPVITTPPANQSAECLTGSATFSVSATGAAPLAYQWRFNGGAILNATNPTLVVSPTLPSTAGPYVVVVSNHFGSMTSIVAVLTLLDTTAPAITCPGPLSVQCDADVPPANFAGGSATDSCDLAPTIMHLGDLTNGICPRTITRTYQATDAGSNSTTCTQIITLNDTNPPTITCANHEVLPAGTPWNFATPVVTDNCAPEPALGIVSTVTNRSCGNALEATRVWIATDRCGNSTTCTQMVTLVDSLAPTVVCPSNLTVQCDASIPPADFAGGTISDAGDSDPLVMHVGDQTNGLCPKIILRTYRGMDACSNATSCIQTITIHDTTPPAVSCGQSAFLELGQIWDFAAPVVTDNCAGMTALTIVSTVTNRTCGNTFVATRVWQATDGCSNSTFCTQVVILVDLTPPALTCPPALTVQCEAEVPAADFAGGLVADPGDPHPLVTHLGDVTNGSCPKIITRTYRAADACGNLASCAQTITIHDTNPPVAGCAADRMVECGTDWMFTSPAPLDLCDGTNVAVAALSTVTNGLCGKTFSATRTWVVADGCGNFVNCSQTVTVVDTMPPVLVCASNQMLSCDVSWSFADPVVTDLCDDTNVFVVVSSTVTNQLEGPSYAAIRTWTATDTCSNVSTCSQTVTVRDVTPPTITCPTNRVVQCAGPDGATVAYAVVTADNCDASPAVACIPPSGFLFPPGPTVVSCRATDVSGNTNTCTFTVTVDPAAPLLNLRQQGTDMVICWSTSCTGFVLESAPSLNLPIGWLPVGAAPVVDSDQLCVTLPITGSDRFFRLRRN